MDADQHKRVRKVLRELREWQIDLDEAHARLIRLFREEVPTTPTPGDT